MKAECPDCHSRFELAVAYFKGQEREIFEIYASLGACRDYAFEYMQKFKSPQGRLSIPRHLRLLKELENIYITRQFPYWQKVYHCPQNIFYGALAEICAKNNLGQLQNHNYFKKILIGHIQKLGPAAAEEKVQTEKACRETLYPEGSESRGTTPEPEDHGEPLTPARLAKLRDQLPWNKKEEKTPEENNA